MNQPVQRLTARVVEQQGGPVLVLDERERYGGPLSASIWPIRGRKVLPQADVRALSSVLVWCPAQPGCHAHQLGQRPRSHLVHDLPAVRLHGDLGQAELGRDLLVRMPDTTNAMMSRSRSVSDR